MYCSIFSLRLVPAYLTLSRPAKFQCASDSSKAENNTSKAADHGARTAHTRSHCRGAHAPLCTESALDRASKLPKALDAKCK